MTYQTYDDAGRVSQVLTAKSDNTVLASYDYVRDARGNPTRITAADDSYRDFTYDGPNRLISEIWRDSGGVLLDRKVYFYDEASNRSRLEQDGEPTVYYTYDARNAMTSVEPAGGTATTMEYNAAGSLVKETTGADVTYYVWGADEMLEAVQLPDASWNYFSYDGDQRRWQKTDGEGTKRYRWNAGTSGKPGLAVVQEADDSDDTTAQFTHDQGVTIMPGVGTILSVREDSASHFLHTDAQGTTREATDSSQAIDATFDLDAFGVLRGSSGAFTTPYLFTGKERDPDPGLDYFIARQYAPGRGVFLSKDPIPTPTWMYSYAHQGPLVAVWGQSEGAPTCVELRRLMARFKGAETDAERREALRAFYRAIADYLRAVGCKVAAGNFEHWLEGTGRTRTIAFSDLEEDAVVRQAMADSLRYLLYGMRGIDCCSKVCATGDHSEHIWPDHTCLVGAMGTYTLHATVVCCVSGTSAAADGTMSCAVTWRASDTFDWHSGVGVPCLPGCDLGEPIWDDWALQLETMSAMGGPAQYEIRATKTKGFSLPCPMPSQGAVPPEPGDYGASRIPRYPRDWPGPPCLWSAFRYKVGGGPTHSEDPWWVDGNWIAPPDQPPPHHPPPYDPGPDGPGVCDPRTGCVY